MRFQNALLLNTLCRGWIDLAGACFLQSRPSEQQKSHRHRKYAAQDEPEECSRAHFLHQSEKKDPTFLIFLFRRDPARFRLEFVRSFENVFITLLLNRVVHYIHLVTIFGELPGASNVLPDSSGGITNAIVIRALV